MNNHEVCSDSDEEVEFDEFDAPWNPEEDRGSCAGTTAPKKSKKTKKMSPKIISVWNFKGGVGKTTTSFSIGYALARMGHNVMFVDADPQMNLTNTAIRYDLHRQDSDEKSLFARLRELDTEGACNLTDAFTPVITGKDALHVNLVKLSVAEGEQDNGTNNDTVGALYLLRGSNEMMELTDVDERVGEGYRESKDNRQNYPGAIYHIVSETAKLYECDYVVVDCCPACTPLTRTLLFSSNSFLMPCKADGFSIQALEILSVKMKDWFKQYCDFRRDTDATARYKLPKHDVKFAGCTLIGTNADAKHGPENSRPMKKMIQEIIVARDKLRDGLPAALKCDDAVDGWAAVFPNTYQLGLIAQRSSVPAPYLPDSYLKEMHNGAWRNMNKTNRKRTQKNRETQRDAIDGLVARLLPVTNYSQDIVEVEPAGKRVRH
eukprot:CAMPEP_0184988070 /NCGR_PEP_ID=MMETSP1098-20130426/22771_1 /TAXON_ID=89044 /ORGANISM="Spumella elongata, Strain CCAP 955/1" /LENGTH=432 /DNA_ID=CAMNT_0027512733 /DNA_START=6 /DNA_END=1304 /DNA_ORIENTATION=-